MTGRQRACPRAVGGVMPLIALAVGLGALPGAAVAQENTSEREAERAIGQLKSPFCPGLMLEVCPTDSANVLREEIHDLAAAGLPADSIVDRVVAERGEIYRALPRVRGKGLLAWMAPPLALMLGLVGVGWVLRRSRAPAPSGAAEVTEEEAARVRAALEALER